MKHKRLFSIFSLSLLLVLWSFSMGFAADDRVGSQPDKGANSGPTPTYVTNANELVQALVGPNVMIANSTLVSSAVSAGTFTGGSGVVGFDSGVVLSSGDITFIQGPNLSDSATGNNGLPGDSDLNALIPGYSTYDATILEFDFLCGELSSFTFQYVFTSEEYNEYVNSSYNDVFAFFLDGTDISNNIAVVPSFCSHSGLPVAINNVNCGNPFSGTGPNCDCYLNNDLDDGGGTIDTEMDGQTLVFYATATVDPDVWHHIKIAIADAGDSVLDSNVLIKGESFDCGGTPELGACCDGADCYQLTLEECVAGQYEPGWIGVGVPCEPNLCNAPPNCDAGGPYPLGNAGEPIQFDASASFDPNGSIVDYAWDFGDGTTGSGVAPTHAYAEDGSYNVVLCVTDNDGNTECCSPASPVVPAEETTWGTLKSLYR